MTPITATVHVGARDITVRELAMQEIRQLIASDEQTDKPEPDPEPDATTATTATPEAPPTPEQYIKWFVSSRLQIDGVHMDYIRGMTDLKESDYAAALPSQLGELAAKVKALNPFFFDLLHPHRSSRGSSSDEPVPPSSAQPLNAPSPA